MLSTASLLSVSLSDCLLMHRPSRAVKRPLSPSVPQLAPDAPRPLLCVLPKLPPLEPRAPPRLRWTAVCSPWRAWPSWDPTRVRWLPIRPTRPRGLRSAHLWRTSSVRSPRSRRRPGMSSSSSSTSRWTCGARHRDALCCTPALAPSSATPRPLRARPRLPRPVAVQLTSSQRRCAAAIATLSRPPFRDLGRVFPVRPADAPRQPLHRRRGRQVHQHPGQ